MSSIRTRTLTVVSTLSLCIAAQAAAAMLTAGGAMPEWSLKDHTGAVVRSSELAGKCYLLWFYPKAQTPGCTTEARGLRTSLPDLTTAGVTILGVSFDAPEANKAFVDAEALPFRLLSDEDRKVAVAVGAADSDKTPVARRVSYLVDANGKVLKAYGEVTPDAHAAEVLADAKSMGCAAKGSAAP